VATDLHLPGLPYSTVAAAAVGSWLLPSVVEDSSGCFSGVSFKSGVTRNLIDVCRVRL
jgi:hypothetical protein